MDIQLFGQGLPVFSDAAYIQNTFTHSQIFTEITENIISASKILLSTVDGIDEDVRLSKRV